MRNVKIDLLRFFGLSLIILAHVNPPFLLFELRNFDVVLLVFISGVSFNYSRHIINYPTYVWNRIKRLVFPVWIFLSIYFLLIYIINPSKLDIEKMFDSYLLLEGYGYVWIIRVFLLIAIVSPSIKYISNNISSNIRFISLIIILLIGYQAFLNMMQLQENTWYTSFVSLYLFYVIAYSSIFALGLRVEQFSKIDFQLILSIVLILFILFICYYYFKYNELASIQQFKYPPSMYYLLYGSLLSLIIWSISSSFYQLINNSLFRFIGQNTIWIYLWHIPFVYIGAQLNISFFTYYMIVYASSISIAWIQVTLVNELLIKNISDLKIQKNIKQILTG